jgi:hypothetical protein
MDAFSPIRKARIAEVEGNILRKLYDTRELREKAVNKFAHSGDFGNGVTNFTMSNIQKRKRRTDLISAQKKSAKASLGNRDRKIKEAREKSQRGYYNKPEVFSKIAQRLIDLFAT